MKKIKSNKLFITFPVIYNLVSIFIFISMYFDAPSAGLGYMFFFFALIVIGLIVYLLLYFFFYNDFNSKQKLTLLFFSTPFSPLLILLLGAFFINIYEDFFK
jgi:hypothetical protein